jgi:hypothetical protein
MRSTYPTSRARAVSRHHPALFAAPGPGRALTTPNIADWAGRIDVAQLRAGRFGLASASEAGIMAEDLILDAEDFILDAKGFILDCRTRKYVAMIRNGRVFRNDKEETRIAVFVGSNLYDVEANSSAALTRARAPCQSHLENF